MQWLQAGQTYYYKQNSSTCVFSSLYNKEAIIHFTEVSDKHNLDWIIISLQDIYTAAMSQTLGELQSVRKWEHRKSVVRCRQLANTWPLCIIFIPWVGRRDLPAANIDGALLWVPRGRAMDEVCRTLWPWWGVAWRGGVNLHPPGSGPSPRGRSPIVVRPATSNTSSPPQQLASHEGTQTLTFNPNIYQWIEATQESAHT